MRILTIDTAMGACSAALHDSGVSVAHRHQILARGHAEAIVPMIEAVLSEAGLTVSALDRIGVTRGPGTFTGVRVGLATARALAIGINVDVAGISTLHAIALNIVARRKLTANASDQLAILCDARRSEVYVQMFDASAYPHADPIVVNYAVAANKLTQQLVENGKIFLVGSGVELVLPHLTNRNCNCEWLENAPHFPDADTMAPAIAALQPGDMVGPTPLYLRQPDAKLPKSG